MLTVSQLDATNRQNAENLTKLITPEDDIILAADLDDQDVLALALVGIADVGGERVVYGDALMDTLEHLGLIESVEEPDRAYRYKEVA